MHKTLVVLLLATLFPLFSAQGMDEPQPPLPAQKLVIQRNDGKKVGLIVEIARSYEEQRMGLMFREKLPTGHGMLFIFEREKVAAFWMKNTRVALDILYIRSNGTIESIHPDRTPFSLEMVSAGELVKAALELPAGSAKKYGLKPGDKLIQPRAL